MQAEKEDGCFICRSLADASDRENLVLKRGKHCAIMMNKYPYNNGHLMVCALRHIPDLLSMSNDERLESMNLVSEAIEALKAAIDPEGFNVGINLGRAAGASLQEHIHIHIVPRWTGDTNFMPVMDDVKMIPQSLDALWDQLYPILGER